MFRVTDLLDLPIVTISQDKRINFTVKSILIDGINNRVGAFVCKGGTNKKYSYIIPYQKVISVDINGVIIQDSSKIQKIQSKDLNNFMQLDSLLNKPIKSKTGDLHGILTDIYINLMTGKIMGYELSEGYIDDIVKGRRVIDIKDELHKALINNEIVVYQRLN